MSKNSVVGAFLGVINMVDVSDDLVKGDGVIAIIRSFLESIIS